MHPQTPVKHYNAGSAALKLRAVAQAQKYFEKTLELINQLNPMLNSRKKRLPCWMSVNS